MKKIPKVAIVTRTKDRPILLERAIKSVEAQTFSDYVHVIFNDGGSRRQVERVVERVSKDTQKRIQLIHNEVSQGLTPSLNKAIMGCDSEYVTILDDDDTWHKDRLKKTISFLDNSDQKVVIVKMDIIIEDITENGIKKISQELHPQSGEGEISLYKQCHRNYLSNGIITYHRNIYDELGGYDESLETAEDWDFGIRLMLEYDVAFLRDEESLFFYHQRPSSKGDEGNSGLAKVYIQERTLNKIRNKYLREDIKKGRFGVGYIMNAVVTDETLVRRLEGHTSHVGEQIKETVRDTVENANYIYRIKKRIIGQRKNNS